MESLLGLLNTLNTLSPLAVIGLLALIVFMLVKGKTGVDQKVDQLAGNHIHDLSGDLKAIIEILQRLEVKFGEDLTWLKARLNGGSHGPR